MEGRRRKGEGRGGRREEKGLNGRNLRAGIIHIFNQTFNY